MENLLAALVSDGEVEWPFEDDAAAQQFLDAAERHGMLPLVARQLRRSRAGRWPESLRTEIGARARHRAVVEQLHRAELLALLRELATRGVRPLLFKGAALAYSHYPYPCLRPRSDVDLLVAESDVDPAIGALRARGYAPLEAVTGRLVVFQQTFVRRGAHGVRHAFDLHWRVANRPAFAQLLPWKELASGARPVDALDGLADAPGTVHALLIACMHRVAHHYDAPDLMWVYDIHLLASSMTEEDAVRFRTMAIDRGLASICARGLTLSEQYFGTVTPAALLHLEAPHREPLADYMRERFRPFDVLVSDLRALPGWRARWQLLREHLFPPPAYLRGASARLGTGPLPFVYARRLVRGAYHWLRTSAARP